MDRVRNMVHAKEVYEKGFSGKQIRIALLDSGVYPHEDLGNRIVYFRDFIANRTEPYDDYGHGTHIAGILSGNGALSGGKYAGIAPESELVVLKVLDENGNGTTETALKALRWIKENHNRYRIRLLNFSIAYLPGVNKRDQRRLLNAVEELWELGIAVVTPSGNLGPSGHTVSVPGISRKVITVGASDDRDHTRGRRGYSGRGPTDCCIVKPEILAPGTGIVSLSNTGGYVSKSGTSMAAPVVCGALALALEYDPLLSPLLLKLQLFESVDRRFTENERCWGILHVDHLIDML